MYFNPVDDNQLLAIYQSRAVLWNIASGKQQTLDHNHATIMQAAFDPKGQFIVTAANDGTVRLFRTQRRCRYAGRRIARPPRSGLRGRRCARRNDRLRVGRWIGPVLAGGGGRLSIADTKASKPQRSKSSRVLSLKILPYLDYGSDRITLPEQILCSLTDACENKLSQAAQ